MSLEECALMWHLRKNGVSPCYEWLIHVIIGILYVELVICMIDIMATRHVKPHRFLSQFSARCLSSFWITPVSHGACAWQFLDRSGFTLGPYGGYVQQDLWNGFGGEPTRSAWYLQGDLRVDWIAWVGMVIWMFTDEIDLETVEDLIVTRTQGTNAIKSILVYGKAY